jgi:methylmalonyl-CoA mutase N-terminal domain/subunit
LQAQQPLVNVVRTTVQALAAVLGGAQSLHTNSFDEALALPTENSARLALRTQQVLAHESGAGDWVDPLGGSYAVEALTSEIEKRASEHIAKIDELGGMVEAVKQGFQQREIADAAFRYQQELESGERKLVGVNAYTEGNDGEGFPTLRIDPRLEAKQIGRVRAVRERRDPALADGALERLEEGARDQRQNLMPLLLDAARADVTEGEMIDTLQGVFGSYSESPAF